MRRRRIARPQRKPVFLGCEGESELGYGAFLRRLREEHRPDLHIELALLRPGGGDPLALVELACQKTEHYEITRGMRFHVRAVLLDRDLLGESSGRDAKMFALATNSRIRLVWQDPSHEALLLRHIDGCQNLRPATAAIALAELRRRWPSYSKGSSGAELSRKIALQHVKAAASVEPDLRAFCQKFVFHSDPS